MTEKQPAFACVHLFIAAIAAIVLISPGPALAGFVRIEKVTVELTFPDQVTVERIGDYDLLDLPGGGCQLYARAGMPLLPVRYVRAAVPAGSEVIAVSARRVARRRLPGTYNIYPSQPSVPLNKLGNVPFVPGREDVYAQDTEHPASAVEYVRTATIRGQDVALLKVYPLQMVPAEGEVLVNTIIEVDIWCRPPLQAAAAITDARDAELVRSLVVNPGDLTPPPAPLSPTDPNDVRYLIICDAAFVGEFQTLADWRTRCGVPAEIITTATIYATYPGFDDQKKIQNCIRDYMTNKGLLYVLLGGDDTTVPDRNCYVKVQSEEPLATTDTYTEPAMPADIYYSCLDDDDWDDNGNGLFGESNWGEPVIDTVDFEPDVYIGRASVQTAADAAAFVNKVLAYEKNPPMTNYAKRFLLSGTRLWNLYYGDDIPPGYDHEPVSDAEIKCDILYNTSVSPYWPSCVRHRFYDTKTEFDTSTPGDYDLTAVNAVTKITEGYNIMYIATHGWMNLCSMETGGSFTTTHAGQCMNTNRAGIFYTIACLTNHFDNYDPCLGEAFIRNPKGGMSAYMACSRYGFGKDDQTLGTSMRFGCEFFRQLFDEDRTILGEAFAWHKEAFAIEAEALYGNAARWLMFGFNLLGDPAMPIWTDDPATFSPLLPEMIATGSQAFTVEAGVEGATVCCWKGSEVYDYAAAGPGGTYQQSIEPTTPGAMLVTITKHNHVPSKHSVTVLDAYIDSDMDGLLDGWEMQIVNHNLGDAITTIAHVDPDDDYDNDGFTNGEEERAGTDPTSASSKLAVIAIGTGSVEITWATVNGKTYVVQYWDGTAGGHYGTSPAWADIPETQVTETDGSPGDEDTESWSDHGTSSAGTSTTGSRFYRIRLVEE